MSDLEDSIRKHLPAALFDRPLVDPGSYHDGFRTSGQAKARRVKEILQDLEVDLSRCAYISIGGSYGSEIVWSMENSEISHGVLLEYDPGVVQHVMPEVARLKGMGKELIFIPGDATQQADSIRRAVESWRQKGEVDTVVCSAQAVFHELPSRSPNFHLGDFLTKMLHGWPRSIFISREPCAPSGWPPRVELSLPGLKTELVGELAREIQRHLNFGGDIHRVGDSVELSSALAVETLVKLFYAEDLQHELQERLTNIQPKKFAAELQGILGPSSVTQTYLISKSFVENYRKLKVCARHPRTKQEQPIPLVFCEFIGDSRQSTAAGKQMSLSPTDPASAAGEQGATESPASGKVVKSVVEPTPPPNNGLRHNRQADSHFVEQARLAIDHIVAECSTLKKAIDEKFTRTNYTGQQDLVSALEIRKCLGTVVNDILYPATEACLKGLPQKDEEFLRSWEAAREVLAWLCVLSVKPEWVTNIEQSNADFSDVYFEIPVMTELGLEILSSRYRQMKTRLPDDMAGKSDVLGTDRFPTPLTCASFDPAKVLKELLLSIWDKVYPAEMGKDLSSKDILKLNATLGKREQKKTEHHYLAFSPDQGTPLNDSGFLKSLLKALPNLVIIRMVTPAGSYPLLASDELDLLSEISSFLELPKHLRKRL